MMENYFKYFVISASVDFTNQYWIIILINWLYQMLFFAMSVFVTIDGFIISEALFSNSTDLKKNILIGFQWDSIFFIFVLEIPNYEQMCLLFSQKLRNVGSGGSIVTEVWEKYNCCHKCCPLSYLSSLWTDI